MVFAPRLHHSMLELSPQHGTVAPDMPLYTTTLPATALNGVLVNACWNPVGVGEPAPFVMLAGTQACIRAAMPPGIVPQVRAGEIPDGELLPYSTVGIVPPGG